MMRAKLTDTINWLQKENHKSFYLAFLRVALSAWLLKELYFNWSSLEILYSTKSFIVRSDNSLQAWFPGCIVFIRNHYSWLVWVYILINLANIFGIGKCFTSFFLFLMVDLFQKLNMELVNGGDKMIRLILLYMIFANSYDYFVLHKKNIIDPDKKKLQNLLSNLAAYSIMLQLCLVYFSSGFAKLTNEFWRNGTAVYYTLSVERFVGTSFNHYLVQYGWFDKLANYFTIFFELSFPFFIWIKKLRNPMVISGIIFHLFIYIFMMLYGFEVVFILLYGLFFTNQELLTVRDKCRIFFYNLKPSANK